LFRMRSTVIKVLLMCLFSLVFVLSIQAHEEEAILLKFTPKVGDEYSSAALLVLRADYTEDGKKEEFYSTVGVGFNIRFIEIDTDGIGTGVLSYNMLKVCMPGPFSGTIYYDSTDPFMPVPREAKLPAILLGEEMMVKTDSKFNIIEYCDFEDFVERILRRWYSQSEYTVEEQASELSPEDLAIMKHQITTVLAGFKENSNPMSYYPDRPVRVGDSWVTKLQKENNGLFIELEIVSTLTERTNGIAVIKEEGSVTMDGLALPGEAADHIQLETVEYYGTVRIREDNGFRVTQESKLRVAFKTDDGSLYVNLEMEATEKSLACEAAW